MSDRIPGSSYDNPIWYREKWRIYIGEQGFYQFVHDDYDGEDDHRCGHTLSIDEAKEEIDWLCE